MQALLYILCYHLEPLARGLRGAPGAAAAVRGLVTRQVRLKRQRPFISHVPGFCDVPSLCQQCVRVPRRWTGRVPSAVARRHAVVITPQQQIGMFHQRD